MSAAVLLAAYGLLGASGVSSVKPPIRPGTVDFVRGDLRKRMRCLATPSQRFQENERPEDIGLHEGGGILDGPIHMRFGREVDNRIHAF